MMVEHRAQVQPRPAICPNSISATGQRCCGERTNSQTKAATIDQDQAQAIGDQDRARQCRTAA